MIDTYDLIIIGAGSAGLMAAEFAQKLGKKVALVEKNKVGGDCTWTGCVPSKALIRAAQVAHTVRQAKQFGLNNTLTTVDMARVHAYVQGAIADIYAEETPEQLRAKGISVFLGAAQFVDPATIQVAGRKMSAKKFLIATGAQSVIPPIPGLSGIPFMTYENIFDNQKLPARLLVMGAGPVGVELAQAYKRLGAEVTLIDAGLLPTQEPEVATLMAEVFHREKLQFQPGLVTRVKYDQDCFTLSVDGQDSVVKGDMLLVAVGRRPGNLAALQLEKAGVQYDQHGIQVNDYLQTSNRNIYAAGDCTGDFQFTHYAGWQGFQAVRNALLPGKDRGKKATLPQAVFTDPEIAVVGLTEAAAQQKFGNGIVVAMRPLARIDRARTDHQQAGFIKIIHRPGGAVLGATIVAPHAGEMINELTVAVEQKLSLASLAHIIHVYPTYAIGIQQMAAETAIDAFLDSTLWKVTQKIPASFV